MIQKPVENTMVTNNTNESSSFSIDVSSGKAYQILADGIYRYKIAAIVRELMANCSDSHVDAGCPEKPFRVKRPTAVNPVVEFEDFGTGLGHENIQKVYTSFFTSTKGDSNEPIGALGLGSKTPLAYTTGFSVRDRKDGIESTYTIYKGDDGIPKVTLLGSMETFERNGVCVSIPVKGQDFQEFDEYIHFYSQFYPVAPNIHPEESDMSDQIRESLDRRNEFSIIKRTRWTPDLYSVQTLAMMGPIPYPVNVKKENLDETEWAIYQHLKREGTVVFHFNIGDLDISASRESLSEDPRTMATFHDRVKQVLSSEKAKYRGAMDAIETERDLYNFYHMDAISASMVKDMAASGELAAKNIGVFNDPRVFFKAPRVLDRINKNRNLYGARLFPHGSSANKIYRRYERYAYLQHEYFLKGGTITIIEADRKNTTGMIKAAREYAEEHKDQVVICLRKPFKKALKDDLLRELSYADVRFIPFSTLKAKAPKKPAQQKNDNQVTACSVTGSGYEGSMIISIDNADNFMYADRDAFHSGYLNVEGLRHGGIDIDNLPPIINQFLPEGVTVILRTSANSKRLEKLGVKSLSDAIADVKSKQDMSPDSDLGKAIRRCFYCGSRTVHHIIHGSRYYHESKAFGEFVHIGVPEAVEYNKSLDNTLSDSIKSSHNFIKRLKAIYADDFDEIISLEIANLGRNLEDIKTKYPMLDLTEASTSDKMDYVEMINQRKGDNQ